MKISRSISLVLATGAAGLVLSGCPLLMIGGLGYSGYQYKEKEGVFAPGQPLGGSAPASKDDKSGKSSGPNSKPPPADNNIE